MAGVSGRDTKLPRSAVYQRLTLPLGETPQQRQGPIDFTPYPAARPLPPLAAFSSDAPPGLRRDANVIQQYGFSEGPIRPPGIMNPQAGLEDWNTPFPRPNVTQADYDRSRQNVANLPYLTDEAEQTILDTSFRPEISSPWPFVPRTGSGPVAFNPFPRWSGISLEPGSYELGTRGRTGAEYFNTIMLHEQTHVLDAGISNDPEFIHWAGEAVDSGLIRDVPGDPSRFAHWYTQLTALPPSLVPENLRPFMPYKSFEETGWPFGPLFTPGVIEHAGPTLNEAGMKAYGILEPIQAVMELPLMQGQVGVWFPKGIPNPPWGESMTSEQIDAMMRFNRISGTRPPSGTMSVRDFLILSKLPENMGGEEGGKPLLVTRNPYAT